MPINLADVQANVLRGFRRADALPLAEYVFVRLGSLNDARAWLSALKASVKSCKQWTPAAAGADGFYVINVGFTYPGLCLLAGKPATPPTNAWPHADLAAFAEGSKARSERTPAFGDVGDSHPSTWESHYRDPGLHALISLSARAPAGLSAARSVVQGALAHLQGTAGEIGREVGAGLSGGVEHFGFVDGIGQPDVRGSGLPKLAGGGTPTQTGWKRIPAGEFVLGESNARNGTPHAGNRLLSNGSFIVFRKLRQHVAELRDYLQQLACRTGKLEELLAARLVGRWRSGAPLILAPSQDDASLGADDQRNNDFRYAGDAKGVECPLGAHIRRTNPRDEPSGPTEVQIASRRMIRRSLPYGAELPPGSPDDGQDRGMLFVAVNANIEQQFEFVQSSWINSTLSSSRLTLDADKDPIVGANDGSGKYLMPAKLGQNPIFAWDLPRFVSVRGSAYFFWPSLTALGLLADGSLTSADWPFP